MLKSIKYAIQISCASCLCLSQKIISDDSDSQIPVDNRIAVCNTGMLSKLTGQVLIRIADGVLLKTELYEQYVCWVNYSLMWNTSPAWLFIPVDMPLRALNLQLPWFHPLFYSTWTFRMNTAEYVELF